MNYSLIRLDKLIEIIGENEVQNILNQYKCTKDKDVESFLKTKAIPQSKSDISKTYLAFSEDRSLIGYFTIAIKCLTIPKQTLGSTISNNFYKSMNAHDGIVQAYLIGQLSRSDNSEKGVGVKLLDYALSQLNQYREGVGCRVVRIDCHKELIPYYSNLRFRLVKKDSKSDLYQMILILKKD